MSRIDDDEEEETDEQQQRYPDLEDNLPVEYADEDDDVIRADPRSSQVRAQKRQSSASKYFCSLIHH